MLCGPVFVGEYDKDFDQVDAIFRKDYSKRFKGSTEGDARPVLSSSMPIC